MSEEKKTEEKKPEKKAEKKAESPVKEAKVHSFRQKVTKSKWSLERCSKSAKRFETVDAWEKGAPSSFKAAAAHGWIDKCSGHMGGKKSYQRTA